MNSINWLDFNGETFQTFCNDILSFELGKGYVAFNGPGRDGGIDGLFEGAYNDRSGAWRIQMKFHHPETGRVSAFNQLKTEIKRDIEKNITKEDYIIFITNVDINPQQRDSLETIAKKALGNNSKTVDFHLWDGAKIQTLLAHHPIIRLWYSNEGRHQIQKYSDFYQRELDQNSSNSYDFTNRFYHRYEILESLDEFVRSNKNKALIIHGVPGVGKTRLCVEYFKQHLDKHQNWIALVLVSHKLDLEVLQLALSGDKNYIVLIDDADKFDQRDLSDLLTLIKGQRSNRVKLLLTIRSYFLEKLLGQFSERDLEESLDQFELKPLSRPESVSILEEELKDYTISKYLGYFVEMTRGIPIMMMTLLKVIKEGTSLASIKEDAFLKTYVKRQFKNFISNTSQEHEIVKRKVEAVLKLVSLIEPIQIDDQELALRIAENESLDKEEVMLILSAMKLQSIISGRYEYDIKPDLYSDLILEEALEKKDWLKERLPIYSSHVNNIIKNIGYVKQGENGSRVLETLLLDYIKKIDESDTLRQLNMILDTVDSIVYQLPLLALDAINKTLSVYENEKHPLYSEFQQSLKQKNYSVDTTVNNLKTIIRKLIELDDFHIEAFSLSSRLYTVIQDGNLISNISNFNKNDRFENFNCKRQRKILEASRVELDMTDNLNRILFAVNALKSLLKLEFTGTEADLSDRNTLKIYTFQLPEISPIKELRNDVINLMTSQFREKGQVQVKEEILKALVDIPREIFALRSDKFKGHEEIASVLDFLLDLSSQRVFDLKQRQHLKDQLYWYRQWGIDESFHKIIDEIESNLTENDLTERLMNLLHPRYDNDDINQKRREFDSKAQEYVSDHSGEELGIALVDVIKGSEYMPPEFFKFLDFVSSDLDKSQKLIDHLWTNNREFVIGHLSNVFREFRFSNDHQEFFWEYITKLRGENSVAARNCLLHIYNSFMVHNSLNKLKDWKALTADDVEVIISLVHESTSDNYFSLASTLPTLFYVDKPLAAKEIQKFLGYANDQQLDNFLLAIDPIEEANKSEIKDLVLNHTVRLNMTYRLEEILGQLLKEGGFKEVLDYIERRFLFKRKLVIDHKSLLGYDFVPNHRNSGITRKLSESEKLNAFSKVLKWFLDFEFELFEELYSKNIIELFAVNKYVDEDTLAVYSKCIKEYSSDNRKLLKISKSLAEFEEKDETFVTLIIKLLEIGYNQIQEEEELKTFLSHCYISMTSVGVKSGTSGQPFPVDLKMRELLNNTLKTRKFTSPKIKSFFQKALTSIESEINRERFEEGGDSW